MALIDISLETDRMIMKIIDSRYTDRVLKFFDNNRDHLEKWEPSRNSDFYTMSYIRNMLKAEMKEMLIGRTFRMWLFLKKDKKLRKIIGSVALNNIVMGAFRSCHLGYRMDGEMSGKGYMTEAVDMLKRLAFAEMGIHRIEASIMPDNAASLRVVEKLGFKYEGTSPNYLRINGKWCDHVHMVKRNLDMERNQT